MKSIRDVVRGMSLRCAAMTAGAIVLFAAVCVGCRSNDTAAVFGLSTWGDFGEAKEWMNQYKHVVLVRIDENYWEDRGSNDYSFYHFKTTVVRSCKGVWQPSEKLDFAHGVDAPAKCEVNTVVGETYYIFTNEHTTNEIGLLTGEFLWCSPEIDRQLRLLFSKPDER